MLIFFKCAYIFQICLYFIFFKYAYLLSFSPELAFSTFSFIQSCIKDIFSWMIRNKLFVNHDKPNISCLIRQISIFLVVSIDVNLDTISHFQSDMFMDEHISSVVKTCFLQLREFRHFRSYIPKTAAITFANAFIHSRIDNCNNFF